MAANDDQRQHIDALVTSAIGFIEHALRQSADLGEWSLVDKLVDVRRLAADIRRPEPTPLPGHLSEEDRRRASGL